MGEVVGGFSGEIEGGDGETVGAAAIGVAAVGADVEDLLLRQDSSRPEISKRMLCDLVCLTSSVDLPICSGAASPFTTHYHVCYRDVSTLEPSGQELLCLSI